MNPSVTTHAIAHDEYFEQLIRSEYLRLDEEGHTYLDYTGGNLYGISQLREHRELLERHVFGNPHSTNPTSRLATQLVEEAREAVIEFFRAEEYFCVFTQNASGALKIVGECYPFDEDSQMVLLTDNHNSVNGIREFCRNGGGNFSYAPIQYEDLRVDAVTLQEMLSGHPDASHKLFAFPAQSNVSGVKHDLSWIDTAHQLGWDVLLDAAAFVPSSRLDLSIVKPDFVSVSFYKIFGYPTGLGCLLIKKSSFNLLRKPWFAGGTVTLASTKSPHHYLAGNHERFEDGTLNYLDIPAIKIGLDYINRIGIDRINERVTSLTQYLVDQLSTLKHANGAPVVRMFGPSDRTNTGGTVIMNFFDQDGHAYPFDEVEAEANKRMISIRSGCFCNPGIDEINHELTEEELSAYFSSRDQGNYYDMVAFLHKMRGATRVSVGLATRRQDIDTFVTFVKEYVCKSGPEAKKTSRSSLTEFLPFSING